MPFFSESARRTTRPFVYAATFVNIGATVVILIYTERWNEKNEKEGDILLSRATRCPNQFNHMKISATVTNHNRYEMKEIIAYCYQYIMNMNTVESCSSSIILTRSDSTQVGSGPKGSEIAKMLKYKQISLILEDAKSLGDVDMIDLGVDFTYQKRLRPSIRVKTNKRKAIVHFDIKEAHLAGKCKHGLFPSVCT